jgi:hypothetical protein
MLREKLGKQRGCLWRFLRCGDTGLPFTQAEGILCNGELLSEDEAKEIQISGTVGSGTVHGR